jgi:NAD(P)-dependent dehydrogenase (short-subunit alcohol dehydrogenase family)
MPAALITGAARGLGSPLVDAFVARGLVVHALVRRQEDAEDIRRRQPERCFPFISDVVAESLEDDVRAHLEKHGDGLSVLINSAGLGGTSPNLTDVDVEEVLDALVYEYFPGLREIDARRFAGREELVAEFRAGGFAPKAETSFAQPVASTLREFREKVALRAQSKFAHLSEEDFREGMSRLDRMVRAEQSPAPVSERYDVLVFERKHGAM